MWLGNRYADNSVNIQFQYHEIAEVFQLIKVFKKKKKRHKIITHKKLQTVNNKKTTKDCLRLLMIKQVCHGTCISLHDIVGSPRTPL